MSIYTDLLDAVDQGKKFKVDLINKSLWINKRRIIHKGEILHEQDKSKELICEDDLGTKYGNCPLSQEAWKLIEILYFEYKHSVPSKNDRGKSYFKAMSVEELTDAELAYNANRSYMQAVLEGYILFGSLMNWIQWEFGNYWFWKGNDPELVVLKNWIE